MQVYRSRGARKMSEKEEECNCCFYKYPVNELEYFETIMMTLCIDCIDKLNSELESKEDEREQAGVQGK